MRSIRLILSARRLGGQTENEQVRPVPSYLVAGYFRGMPPPKPEKEEVPQELDDSDVPKHDLPKSTKAPEIGTTCTVMRLWQDPTSKDRTRWLTEPPKVEEEEKHASQSPEFAITLQHRDLKRTGRQVLSAIIIRSPELRYLLDRTIPNISGLYSEIEHGIIIQTPFRLLFWYLEYIHEATKVSDSNLAEPAQLLKDVLEEEFRDLLAKRDEMVAKQEINFNTLWTLFKPGITCLTSYAVDYTVAVKVLSIHYSSDPMGKLYYRVKYELLAWDGDHLGWQDSYTDIMEFSGRRKISELEILPVEYHKDSNITGQFVARGKRFMKLAVKEPYMMSFSGETLDRESSPMWWQGEQKKTMNGRVVLDARAYSHYYRRLTVSKLMKRAEVTETLSATDADTDIFKYCCPELHCYALQRKRWVRLWIDNLEEVSFNEQAYPSLVLPGDYKQLLLAFAEAQIDGYGFDDVIAGKGQGILMLLAGPPGTGKTLTAEAVAEHMKRPLYSVSAGELGSTAHGMENELDRVLELCTRWNAVLLLDEADIFLERRTEHDIQRNTIVSVFLRKLEYYRGIMFLTTNRIHSFDEAFKSRIHVAIRYPDLDTEARRTIWTNFMKKAAEIYQHGVDVSDGDIHQLCQKHLNGREIRNIVKSAQLLASRTKQPITKTHLDIVWRVEHEDSAWDEFDGHKNIPNGVMK